MKIILIPLLTLTSLFGKSIYFRPPLEISAPPTIRHPPLKKTTISASPDPRWETFSAHGLGDDCLSLGLWKGDLVAAGKFKTADGTKASHAARWDGTRWHPLGNMNPVSPVDARILPVGDSLFFDHFYYGETQYHYFMAKWDGQDWKDIRGNLPSDNRLVETGGRIYALGKGAFLWEGSWVTLIDSLQGKVQDVEAIGRDLYVSGNFVLPGTGDTVRFAKVSGGVWSALPATQSDDTRRTLGFIQLRGLLHVILSLSPSDTLMVRWEGGAWVPVSGTGLPLEYTQGYQESGGALYIGGPVKGGTGYRIYRYDGTAFHPDREFQAHDGFGISNGISTFHYAGNSLYAGGTFSGIGGVRADRVARWDGSAWHALSGRPAQVGPSGAPVAFQSVDSRLLIAGSFTFAGTEAVQGIATWDGVEWGAIGDSPMPWVNPIPWNRIWTMAAEGSNIFVGGLFDTATCADCHGLAHWDGRAWKPMGTGVEGTVTTMAVVGDQVYAGGDITAIRGAPVSSTKPWVVGWNVSRLVPMGAGLPGPVRRLVSYKDVLHALAIGPGSEKGLYAWGGAWNPVRLSGLKTLDLSNAVESGGELYLSGRFETESREILYLIRWDGQRWAAMNALENVTSMAADSTTLFASGIGVNGDAGFAGLAAWNGDAWTPVTVLPPQDIASLHVHAGYLYVGLRQEMSIGGKWAYGLARWSVSPQSGILASRNALRHPKPGLRISLDGIGFNEFLDLQGRKKAGLPGQKGAAGISVYNLAR